MQFITRSNRALRYAHASLSRGKSSLRELNAEREEDSAGTSHARHGTREEKEVRLERLAVAPGCLAVAAFAAALCSCALSAGAIVTSPQASTPLVVSGPSLDGTLQLPSTYRAIVGWEWTRQNTAADLWRLGALAGYVSPPERTRWLGWEATGRAGLLRSWNGPATEMGWFAGAAVSALLRLESGAQPWTGDSLLQVMPMLVLDLGVNELWPAGRSAETEVAARALLRVHFSSTLIP